MAYRSPGLMLAIAPPSPAASQPDERAAPAPRLGVTVCPGSTVDPVGGVARATSPGGARDGADLAALAERAFGTEGGAAVGSARWLAALGPCGAHQAGRAHQRPAARFGAAGGRLSNQRRHGRRLRRS